jgi:hypothetical protein
LDGEDRPSRYKLADRSMPCDTDLCLTRSYAFPHPRNRQFTRMVSHGGSSQSLQTCGASNRLSVPLFGVKRRQQAPRAPGGSGVSAASRCCGWQHLPRPLGYSHLVAYCHARGLWPSVRHGYRRLGDLPHCWYLSARESFVGPERGQGGGLECPKEAAYPSKWNGRRATHRRGNS